MAKGFLLRYWIRTNKIRFKNRLKTIQDSICNKNASRKSNSISLEGHKVLKLTTQLRNPSVNLACRQTGLTHAFDCIIKAFQNPVCLPIVALAKLGAEQARERLKQIKLLSKAGR